MKFDTLMSWARSVETARNPAPCVLHHQPQPPFKQATFQDILGHPWTMQDSTSTHVITKIIRRPTHKQLLLAILNGTYRPSFMENEAQNDFRARVGIKNWQNASSTIHDATQAGQSGSQLTYGQFWMAYAANVEKFSRKLEEENLATGDTETKHAEFDDGLRGRGTTTPEPDDAEDAIYALPSDLLSELNANEAGYDHYTDMNKYGGETAESGQQTMRDFYMDTTTDPVWIDTARVAVPLGPWPPTDADKWPATTDNGSSVWPSASPAPPWPPRPSSPVRYTSSSTSSTSSSFPIINTPSSTSIEKDHAAELRQLERRARHLKMLDDLLLECNPSFAGSRTVAPVLGSPADFEDWRFGDPIYEERNGPFGFIQVGLYCA
ncbi:uncharacterized protein LAESUDRAFT_724348, partial [Laetiporus sulphureus 93-53]